MMETEIVKLYKYTIRYKPGEMDEYTVILVSDNMKDLIDLIADREMIDPMINTNKWFSVEDFLSVINPEEGCYLFDIKEQNLAIKWGYDVQEQYWTCLFENDCPKSVKNVDEIMGKFREDMEKLNGRGTGLWGGILGDALYGSRIVQNTIREKKREWDLHDAEELDAGIGVIEEIVKGEEEK